MHIRSRMSSNMGQIEPEHLELFALEFGKIAEYDFVYTLSSTNIDQSAPNLVEMYVIIRSQMSLNMDLIGPELFEISALELEILPCLTLEHLELFALEFGKIAEYDFVYTLSSPNIDQSAPNLVEMYVIIRSQMSLNMDLIGPELFEISALELEILPCLTLEHLELFALEFGKIAEYDFVYTLSSPNIDQSAPNLVEMYVIIRSQMSLNMDLIGPELFEISALELEILPCLTLFTL